MNNTQSKITHPDLFDLSDAIERDRSARLAEAAVKEASARDIDNQLESSPWELWLTIAVGLMVIAVAAAI